MKHMSERRHVIDFLFPLALFFVLTATSVALVVLASGIYSRQVNDSEDSFSSRTALAYVTEKLHQNDTCDTIDAGSFDGQNAIIIRQTYADQPYVTYLYQYDGYLRELFIREDVSATASDGRKILSVNNFTFEKSQNGIFHLSCTNEDGSISDTYVSIKSTP